MKETMSEKPAWEVDFNVPKDYWVSIKEMHTGVLIAKVMREEDAKDIAYAHNLHDRLVGMLREAENWLDQVCDPGCEDLRTQDGMEFYERFAALLRECSEPERTD
jgi:hypothetical protein